MKWPPLSWGLELALLKIPSLRSKGSLKSFCFCWITLGVAIQGIQSLVPQTWLFFHSAFLAWQRVSLEKGSTLQRCVHIHTPVLVFYARMSFSSAVTALEHVPGSVSSVMLCIWPFLPIQVLFQTPCRGLGQGQDQLFMLCSSGTLLEPRLGAQVFMTLLTPSLPHPHSPQHLMERSHLYIFSLSHFAGLSSTSLFGASFLCLPMLLPPHAFASPSRCQGLTQCPPHINICTNQRTCLYFDSVRCKSTELSVN